MKKITFALFLAIAAFGLTTRDIFAQTCPGSPGCIDLTFAADGVATTFVPTTQGNLSSGPGVVQGDGKLVAVGDAHLNIGNSFTNVLLRYNVDGSMDGSFGSGGFVYMYWNSPTGQFGNAYAVTTQVIAGDEKIVVAGSSRNAAGNLLLRVERYNSDGSPDMTFGSGGSVSHLNVGYALAVATDANGKIVIGGDANNLVRMNSNGSLDTSFGTGGLSSISGLRVHSIGFQSNGRIVTCGPQQKQGVTIMGVHRFNTNGSLDDGGRSDSTRGDSFSTAGKTLVDFFVGGSSDCRALKVGASDKITAVGTASRKNSSDGEFAAARLQFNGQLDTGFGSSGKATINFGPDSDLAWALGVQSDGKAVLIGTAGPDSAFARFNGDGTIDTSFGSAGRAVPSFSTVREHVRAGGIQFDPICMCEKLVISGIAEISLIDYAIAARYRL